jgi:hypothetical protein
MFGRPLGASTMELAHTFPFVVHVDESWDPSDALVVLALGDFVAGRQPVARSARLQRVRAQAPLLPPGTAPVRTVDDGTYRGHLAVGDGWTLRAIRHTDSTATVWVTATTTKIAVAVLNAATNGATEPPGPPGRSVLMGFWHQTKCGSKRVVRAIDIEQWDTIRANYASRAQMSLERLIATRARAGTGRLLLMHGPPGTGKTTLLRALADAWRGWCQFDYILDPEELLKDPGYLMSVLLDRDQDDGDGGDDDHRSSHKWRLLILEDCDELIRADAKRGVGQALARLLNLTDGLVGQGLDCLICITTNEDVTRLHPAVVRPGRCLAQVHVGPLPREEAARWLGREAGIGADGATLAELFNLRGDIVHVDGNGHQERRVGQYL